MVSRSIAYKLWISNINSSNYIKSSGEFDPNYIEFNSKKISRVNLIAAVIDKYEKENYSSIVIDDGSSQISVKSWNEDKKIIDKTNVGDVILLIGKIRQNNMNPYLFVQPEIIRKIDEKWLMARKKDLEREYGIPEITSIDNRHEDDEIKIEEVKVSSESTRTKILNLIDNMDRDDGVSKEDIMKSIKSSKTEDVIEELLKEGEIFEVNGRYKLLK